MLTEIHDTRGRPRKYVFPGNFCVGESQMFDVPVNIKPQHAINAIRRSALTYGYRVSITMRDGVITAQRVK